MARSVKAVAAGSQLNKSPKLTSDFVCVLTPLTEHYKQCKTVQNYCFDKERQYFPDSLVHYVIYTKENYGWDEQFLKATLRSTFSIQG